MPQAEPELKDEKVRSRRSLERKEEKRKARELMRLDKGSKLAREERRELRQIRSSALQDLLDQELKERDLLLKKKEHLKATSA